MDEIKEIIYEAEDYEKLKDMNLDEVVDVLDQIDDGWLSSSSYYGQEDYEGDESDYYLYKLHQALRIAIRELSRK